jgi:hypothetical protein
MEGPVDTYGMIYDFVIDKDSYGQRVRWDAAENSDESANGSTYR